VPVTTGTPRGPRGGGGAAPPAPPASCAWSRRPRGPAGARLDARPPDQPRGLKRRAMLSRTDSSMVSVKPLEKPRASFGADAAVMDSTTR
jgi:hypothetical protein